VQTVAANTDEQSTQPLLFVDYQSNPVDGTADHKLNILLQRVKFTVHHEIIASLRRFFGGLPDVKLENSWSAKQLEKTKQLVQELQSQTKSFMCHISWPAPLIVIPASPHDPKSNVLVLDLGKLTLETKLQPRDSRKLLCSQLAGLATAIANCPDIPSVTATVERELGETMRAQCYDLYSIKLTSMSCYFILGCGAGVLAAAKKNYVLQPLDLSLDLSSFIVGAMPLIPGVFLRKFS